MNLKNNRPPPLCYIKLCATFQSHWWIQTGVTVSKCPIRFKINFLSHVTLKFNRWPSKTIGHLLYAIISVKLCASFCSHQWIQTGVTLWKCSIRVKIGNFLSHVTLKFDGWPWKTIYINRMPRLCYIKLCASFEQGVYPSELEFAVITPLHKAKGPMFFNNYHPVSLLSVFSKIIEHLMYNHLLNFINSHKIFNQNQFGFHNNHSTFMGLI